MGKLFFFHFFQLLFTVSFLQPKLFTGFFYNSLVVEICENSRHSLVKGDFVFLNPSYYMLMLIKENHIIRPPSSDTHVHVNFIQDLIPQYICGGWIIILLALLGILCYQPKPCFSCLFWFSFLILYVCLLERAKVLADIIGGDAITLADLENFHPEDGMILANTTSIGMQPKVDETPVSKVSLPSCCFFLSIIMHLLKWKMYFCFLLDHPYNFFASTFISV